MLSTILQAILLYAASWVAWRALSRLLVKSPLDVLQGPPQYSWLFGNIPQLFNPDGWDFHFHILERYGTAMKIRGALGERLLVTCDPKALHHILVKDQHVFEQSTAVVSRNNVYFGEGILSTIGGQHRKQRKMMNPVFSINHMRDMIPIFYEVTGRLRAALKKKLENGPQEVDILYWMTRTALELIGQSGMGYSFDSLKDEFDYHPYSRSVKKFATLAGGPAGFFANQFIFPFAVKFKHPRFKRWIAEHIPSQRVQDLINASDTMYKTSVEIIETKKRALHSSDPQEAAEALNKKDVISILMRANAAASNEDRLTDSELFGQVSYVLHLWLSRCHEVPKYFYRTFVFAAMDTTSSALSRVIHLLATHPDVQNKLRDEIKEAQKDGQLSYDQLVSLPYLDAVCRETLRVYPPVNITFMRTARQDIMVPLSKPVLGLDGKEVTDVFIQNGTNILISVLGANCNPDLWGPDSHEWKPERWLSPLPETVGQAHMPGIYSHLMTFLGGGRACIGFKFSQLEMKVVLSVLLSTFKFSMSEKKISWKMIGIAAPSVEGAEHMATPQLPLKMELLGQEG